MSVQYISNCNVHPLAGLLHALPQNAAMKSLMQDAGNGGIKSKLFNLSNKSPKGLCHQKYPYSKIPCQSTKVIPVSESVPLSSIPLSDIVSTLDGSSQSAETVSKVEYSKAIGPNLSESLGAMANGCVGPSSVADLCQDESTQPPPGAGEKTIESSDDVSVWSASESVGDRGISDSSDTVAKLIDDTLGFAETEAANSTEVRSKVVVQAMPVLEFGNITALEQCISDSSISLNERMSPESRKYKSEKMKFRTSMKMAYDSEDDKTYTPSKRPPYKVKRMMRRNHEMNFHIRPGKGVRLSNINYIASAVQNASPILLRIVHYVLFGTYGVYNNDCSLSQTRRNILHFSGFPFDENSDIFQKKRQCLLRVPYPMLSGMYNVFLRELPKSRGDYAVDKLLKFLLKPMDLMHANLSQEIKSEENDYDVDKFSSLKERALTGPSPIVLVSRLSDNDIVRLVQELKSETTPKSNGSGKAKLLRNGALAEQYLKPVYILQGSGAKLKSFPEIVVRVQKARRRIINILHILLYGKPGSDDVNRLNILEFSGFNILKKQMMLRKHTFLKKLKHEELAHICDIFSLRAKSGNKTKKIWKLLQYLQAPPHSTSNKRKTRDPSPLDASSTSKAKPPQKEPKTSANKRPIEKLGDHANIRSKVECSPPQDLIELNDLLFLKPCDSTEIHQKILDFTPFLCDANSSEFLYRKTLLYYMNFGIIRKIAQLLDISEWENYSSPQDLGRDILKFLVDLRPHVKVRKKTKPPLSQQHLRPHIMKVHKLESRRSESLWNEKEEITGDFGSPSSILSNSTYSSVKFPEGFHENKEAEDASNSTVVVHRISESSYSWTDLRNNVPLTVSQAISDESISLCDFYHHPTEEKLEMIIRNIISINPPSTTIGDLINKVFHCYPKFNLSYRIDFIKAKALEIVKELQRTAVNSRGAL